MKDLVIRLDAAALDERLVGMLRGWAKAHRGDAYRLYLEIDTREGTKVLKFEEGLSSGIEAEDVDAIINECRV